MRKSNFEHLGSAMQDFLKKSGLEDKIKEIELKENWHAIVGPVFSKATQKIVLYKQVLFVTIESPAIKHELLLNKSIIIQRLNESVKKEMIHEIVFR